MVGEGSLQQEEEGRGVGGVRGVRGCRGLAPEGRCRAAGRTPCVGRGPPPAAPPRRPRRGGRGGSTGSRGRPPRRTAVPGGRGGGFAAGGSTVYKNVAHGGQKIWHGTRRLNDFKTLLNACHAREKANHYWATGNVCPDNQRTTAFQKVCSTSTETDKNPPQPNRTFGTFGEMGCALGGGGEDRLAGR